LYYRRDNIGLAHEHKSDVENAAANSAAPSSSIVDSKQVERKQAAEDRRRKAEQERQNLPGYEWWNSVVPVGSSKRESDAPAMPTAWMHPAEILKANESVPNDVFEFRNRAVAVFLLANLSWITLIVTLSMQPSAMTIQHTNAVGLAAVAVFSLVLAVQFLAMLWHRAASAVHYLAALSWKQHERRKRPRNKTSSRRSSRAPSPLPDDGSPYSSLLLHTKVKTSSLKYNSYHSSDT
jgi:hypothetical protein